MKELFQVWKVDKTTVPFWEEPVTEPLSFEGASYYSEGYNLIEVNKVYEDGKERIIKYEVRQVHPEERF